jgi:hypothetical protein
VKTVSLSLEPLRIWLSYFQPPNFPSNHDDDLKLNFNLSPICRVYSWDLSGCDVWGMKCLHPHKQCDCGFESYSKHGYLYAFLLCLCCPVWRQRPCDRADPHLRILNGICGGQNGVGAGFLRVLLFPLSITFNFTNFSILTITRDW